jgi:hypothetical protein
MAVSRIEAQYTAHWYDLESEETKVNEEGNLRPASPVEDTLWYNTLYWPISEVRWLDK